ncbi:BPSL0761 family protein [Variovorax sp. dw_954]|uniref:BPSL0761 family protein n=1 Tax=Variovorax sp. dw_954 TaxID=2720078 RepID=UPI001BD2FEBB|nr:BPSL0761 family protein [Variovorax sp. dw_954]
MTIPRERFRAMRWARELLCEVKVNQKIPSRDRARAAALADAYPSDFQLRELIRNQTFGIPKDIAQPLIAASEWIFGYSHPACCAALIAVRRHLPTPQEITGMAREREPDIPAGWSTVLGVHHWLAPDEDYVDAVVVGWVGNASVVIPEEKAQGCSTEELQHLWPQYLITEFTAGVDYKRLSLMQRVRCTVPRGWHSEEEEHPRIASRCEAAINSNANEWFQPAKSGVRGGPVAKQ